MQAKRKKDPIKHDAILHAAISLFPQKGYTATSMDAIAQAAGVTKQTIYAHYKSKDALFTQMIVSLCERHAPAQDALGVSPQKIEALLYEAGLNFLTFVTSAECVAVTRLVIAETGRYPELARKYYEDGTERLIRFFAEFLRQQSARGLLSIGDAESAASHFIALLKGKHYLRAMLGVKPAPTQKDKEDCAREAVDLFMRLYAHPPKH